jgi:hypothetical protein
MNKNGRRGYIEKKNQTLVRFRQVIIEHVILSTVEVSLPTTCVRRVM